MYATSRTRATVLALLVATGASAGPPALTIVTAPMQAAPNGYVYCVVVATAHKPIDLVTSLVTADGTNVTQFGSSLRVSAVESEDGRHHAEDRAGTFHDGESRCQVVVQGVQRRDVSVVLTAHAEDGQVLASSQNP